VPVEQSSPEAAPSSKEDSPALLDTTKKVNLQKNRPILKTEDASFNRSQSYQIKELPQLNKVEPADKGPSYNDAAGDGDELLENSEVSSQSRSPKPIKEADM